MGNTTNACIKCDVKIRIPTEACWSTKSSVIRSVTPMFANLRTWNDYFREKYEIWSKSSSLIWEYNASSENTAEEKDEELILWNSRVASGDLGSQEFR
jgi:hypothetical protein